MREGSPRTIYLKDYRPPEFLIDRIDLRFELAEEETLVRSKMVVRSNPAAEQRPSALRLNGEDLVLDHVAVDGSPLAEERFVVDHESLTIHEVPNQFELEVITRIRPQDNTALEGLYKSSGNFCTQCEAEGFRKITYYLDRPDVMAVYTTTIVADRECYPVMLSNGNLVDSGGLEDGRHFATWHDPFPKPSYLFALVAGRLACQEGVYKTVSGREVALKIYVEEHNLDKCDHAMISLQKAMAWDEKRFGLEYDLDIYMIVAVDDFNMGAMENKGLNVFNSKYVLARPETATDDDYKHIEAVIAHEYFHNWTGNRVTCRDWFQLSLKEGLTVFRDQEFTASVTSRAVKRIHDVRMLRTLQFAEDASAMAHPVRPQSYMEINNFYTVTVYEKGAEIVRMYQTLLGREGFRQGMDLYFARHDGQAVTTDDFAAAMADANGVDLTQFKLWYDQAGTPVVEVEDEWTPDGKYTLTVRQSCPPTPGQEDKAPYHIPLDLGLLGKDGRDLPLRLEGEATPAGNTRVINLHASTERYTFVDLPERPVPSLLRNFSAPVTLRYAYDTEKLCFLLAHDSDPFNRWEAGQRLAVEQIMGLIRAYRSDSFLQPDPHVVDAFGKALASPDLDEAFVAELLTLPGEAYIAELMDEIDVDAIHVGREALRQGIAAGLEELFVQIYQRQQATAPYAYNAADAGRRRLKNLCLAYLTASEQPEFIDLAMSQYRAADNMTDSMGALGALRDSARAQREDALQQFHDRWQGDPLVMDKWFSLQATSSREDTLATVKRLMNHPLFNLTNPNRVRALIGAFAGGNPVRFHDPSGAGYAFVAEQIRKIDPKNPQVAARLAKVFSRWRKYDPLRQDLMRKEIEGLRDVEGLSKDVYEVVAKSLG